MKPSFLFALLMCVTALPAREPLHPPLEILPRAVVTDAETRKAAELLRDLPQLTPAAASARLAELLKDRDLPRQLSGPWPELLARAGGPRELQQLYVGVVASLPDDCCEGGRGPDFDPTFAFADEDLGVAAQVLIRAAQQRGVVPASPYQDGKLHFGNHVYMRCPEGMSTDLARLAALYHVTEDYERIADHLRRAETHLGACEALTLAGGGPELVEVLEPVVLGLEEPLAVRGALLVLARVAPEHALKHTARVLSSPMSDEELANLCRQLLAAKPYVERLRTAPPWYLPPRVRTAWEKAARAVGEDALADRLAPADDAALPASEFAAMAEKVRAQGDAGRGELVFRGAEAACAQCHGLGRVGAGTNAGPDLGRIGMEMELPRLIAETLQPYARVAKGYDVARCPLPAPTVLSGTQHSCANFSFVVASNPQAAAPAWPPADSTPYAGSSMPSGLTDALPAQATLDLFAFLSKLGAPEGIDASRRDVARVWRLESDDRSRASWRFIDLASRTGNTNEVLALVNGELRREDCLEALYDIDRQHPFSLVTRFRVTQAGPVSITVPGVHEVWINQTRLEPDAQGMVARDLGEGWHRLDLHFGSNQMPETVRVSSKDAQFSGGTIYRDPQ